MLIGSAALMLLRVRSFVCFMSLRTLFVLGAWVRGLLKLKGDMNEF